ncbi:MAG: sulfurtransferase complex subunit TusC [Gammaproteobacteria bacterium]|nr:sulfurtransferase complex subunit TusC [Gammaproteobacteria bacterium]MDD9799013.1 sulfurtransferase complex subunit TusC [Gammaproteobacteria bacterium]MDD9871708.1 sulfurtransferase complex subunit TusC [Gammaproteobacteria bacterium]
MNQNAQKKIACIQRRAPHGSVFAAEGLDLALVAATFDHEVTLVFMDDGVFQLLKNQAPERALGMRDFCRALGALPQYGCEQVLAERESLNARNVAAADFLIAATVVERAELLEVLAAQDCVIDF